MWSIIAARVVVLPEPVGPVTSTSPRFSSARRRTTGGSPSSSIGGMPGRMCRSTIATEPRWRNTFTRNRPTPFSAYAKSASLDAMNSSARILGITANATRSVSAAWTDSDETVTSSPSRRMCGGEPTLMWMSEAPRSTASRNTWSRSSTATSSRASDRPATAGPLRVSAPRPGPCRDVWPNSGPDRPVQPVRRCRQSSPTAVTTRSPGPPLVAPSPSGTGPVPPARTGIDAATESRSPVSE